jgi:hypothetical protein
VIERRQDTPATRRDDESHGRNHRARGDEGKRRRRGPRRPDRAQGSDHQGSTRYGRRSLPPGDRTDRVDEAPDGDSRPMCCPRAGQHAIQLLSGEVTTHDRPSTS